MNQYDKWEEATKDASDYIRAVMSLPAAGKEESEFQKLAKWIFNTEENPWGFMPQGWADSKGSAQGFEAFLHVLHHAIIDDGDVCFVDDPTHGPCMEFTFYGDEEEGDGVYLDHHRKNYEEQDARMNEMLDRCRGEDHEVYSSIADIEYHTNIQRFIDGFEKHRIKSEERNRKNNEWIKENNL